MSMFLRSGFDLMQASERMGGRYDKEQKNTVGLSFGSMYRRHSWRFSKRRTF
jgi:hypothetical protein